MKNIEISPVTRIEGHAKITVQLDDSGNVSDAHLHVMEIRGFEKFLEGAAVEEAPRITPRICGICQTAHQKPLLTASLYTCLTPCKGQKIYYGIKNYKEAFRNQENQCQDKYYRFDFTFTDTRNYSITRQLILLSGMEVIECSGRDV